MVPLDQDFMFDRCFMYLKRLNLLIDTYQYKLIQIFITYNEYYF